MLVLFSEYRYLDLERIIRFSTDVCVMRELSSLLMQLEKNGQLRVEEFDELSILVSLILARIQSLLHPSRCILSCFFSKVH